MDIDLDIVRPMHQNGRFFKDEFGRDQIEISFVGSKDTLIKDVSPQIMAQFRSEWDAYCDGRPVERRKGTPLTDVPSVVQQRAEQFVSQNVHTAEELAALSDGQCQALGHGTLVARREAQNLLRDRGIQAASVAMDRIQEATKKIGAQAAPEVAELKAEVAEIKEGMSAILAALADLKPKKPGRPKKEASDAH